MTLLLQVAQLALIAYGVSLLYDCLSSLDLIAYGEDGETETEVTILDETSDSGRRYADVIDLDVEDDDEDPDAGEGFFDILDEDFDSQRELHHD